MVVVEDDIVVDQENGLCLVGRVLMDSIVNFEIDSKRVKDGMPWFFNRHLIVFHRDFIRRFWEYDASLVMRGSRGELLSGSINLEESVGEIWLGSIFEGCAKEERADGE
ncbi:hypothetical protein CXB51_019000 [Gossypium anomalum]|uniref:Uncharacterized protein n=1 Tax=Gossypium anomalum TaxID=47600 RepID=A0A8J6CZD7_9ROSI|nr:hypothetical protein CXB51_019000 [Gossypium anomalum]